MKKKLLILLCVLLVALLSAGLVCWHEAKSFLETPPEKEGQEVLLDITPGTTIPKARALLESKGIITSDFKFRLLMKWKEPQGKLQAGRFAFRTDWLPEQVLQKLFHGRPELTRVTIPEGQTWWQTAKRLEASGLGRFEDFAKLIKDPEFLRHYGIPFESAEGFLMPDTYLLRTPRDDEAQDEKLAKRALGRMIDQFWKKGESIWGANKPSGDELKRIVILASIAEKESSVERELPRITGVYQNRIRNGMLLQADPTVIYGLGESFNGNITRANLNDSSNRYNTYKNPGLPPGPICSFGLPALKAAISPEEHEYIYFVAITDGGTHQFSKTLAEHNAAVARYLQNRRKAR